METNDIFGRFNRAAERYPRSPSAIAWHPPGDLLSESTPPAVADFFYNGDCMDKQGGIWRFWLPVDDDARATIEQLGAEIGSNFPDAMAFAVPDPMRTVLHAAIINGDRRTWDDNMVTYPLGEPSPQAYFDALGRGEKCKTTDDGPRRFLVTTANVFRSVVAILGESKADIPPMTLLANLSKQQQKMVCATWESAIPYEDFIREIWPNPCNPETHQKGITRLNTRLLELGQQFTLSHKGKCISLDRPDKI